MYILPHVLIFIVTYMNFKLCWKSSIMILKMYGPCEIYQTIIIDIYYLYHFFKLFYPLNGFYNYIGFYNNTI